MTLPRKWKTKDGRKLWIKDMTTSHIRNCMRLLDRSKDNAIFNVLSLPYPNGEMAQDCFDRELDELENAETADLYPVYTSFVKELEKRGEYI
jgi:hypothetical protein